VKGMEHIPWKVLLIIGIFLVFLFVIIAYVNKTSNMFVDLSKGSTIQGLIESWKNLIQGKKG
jgi:hypothetical protein